MAHSQVIEEESGTCRGWLHPHNGYYAGSFATSPTSDSARGPAAGRHLHVVADPQPRTFTVTVTAAAAPVARREAA
jgi:hypothetical protein